MASTLVWRLAAGALAAVAVVGAGCGGSGSAVPRSSDVFPMARIVEYVGDGHGGTKPFPTLIKAMTGDVNTQSMGTRLQIGGVAKEQKVQRRLANWCYIDPVTSPTTLVVTCQPAFIKVPGDADLYVMRPRPTTSGVPVHYYSDRSPSGGGDGDTLRGGGYAPDWVAFNPAYYDPYPAAQVGIYGYYSPQETTVWKHFLIEVDEAQELSTDGTPVTKVLGQRQSDWYYFWTSTTCYIEVQAIKGDPDFYVYEDDSKSYVDGAVGPGGGTVTVHAYSAKQIFIRVYAYPTGTTTKYTISAEW